MKLLSIQVGQPKTFQWKGKEVLTAIFKIPVSGSVRVRTLNIDGDRQGDTEVHGGEHKAVYGYGFDVYPWWLKRLGVKSLEMGAFGENLTFDQLDEKKLCIGDILQVGGCQLQVSQPRLPCSRLNLKFNDPQMVKSFMESGRPGIYFRVVKEGDIKKGDSAKVVACDPRKVPLQILFDLAQGKKVSKNHLEQALKVPILLDSWKHKIEKVLLLATT